MKQPVYLGICNMLITLMVLSAPAMAFAGTAGRTGLFGDIRLGGGGASIRPSGLEVLDDNENLDNLNNKGSKQSEELILLGAELGYTFEKSGTTLQAAIGTEGVFSLSLRHEVGGVGELTLSALYEKKDVWENPYLVGVARSRTDAESLGFAITWEQIMGTGARLVFEQMNVDVEDDLIGKLESDLRREGKDTTLGLGYAWDLAAAGVFIPKLSHVWINRKGDANSGCGYVMELEHVRAVGRLAFVTSLEWKHSSFDGVHPLFDKRRAETAYGISETISFAEPFGFKNWSLQGFAAVMETDSNITFFDSSSLLAGAGIGYKF